MRSYILHIYKDRIIFKEPIATKDKDKEKNKERDDAFETIETMQKINEATVNKVINERGVANEAIKERTKPINEVAAINEIANTTAEVLIKEQNIQQALNAAQRQVIQQDLKQDEVGITIAGIEQPTNAIVVTTLRSETQDKFILAGAITKKQEKN